MGEARFTFHAPPGALHLKKALANASAFFLVSPVGLDSRAAALGRARRIHSPRLFESPKSIRKHKNKPRCQGLLFLWRHL